MSCTMRGHQGDVSSANFSPDGQQIITGSVDATARVWDTQTGQLLTILRGHSLAIQSARYSPDGQRVLTASPDGVWLWDVAPETRTTAQLKALVRCRSAERLAADSIVEQSIDPAACQVLPPSAPHPLLWDQRYDPFWGGIYALQAGRTVTANTAFSEASRRLNHFRDQEGLAKLTLAKAALSATDGAPLPDGLIEQVRKLDRSAQPRLWMELAKLAHEDLYRPKWALWLCDELHKSTSNDPGEAGLLRSRELKYRLSVGLAADVLRQSPDVLAAQTNAYRKAGVAALAWVAATQQRVSKDQQTWATKALELYEGLKDGTNLHWDFGGSRHVFLQRPDSAARATALDLFEILEQEKSPVTAERLAKLLSSSDVNRKP